MRAPLTQFRVSAILLLQIECYSAENRTGHMLSLGLLTFPDHARIIETTMSWLHFCEKNKENNFNDHQHIPKTVDNCKMKRAKFHRMNQCSY